MVDGGSVTADNTQNYSKFVHKIIFLIRGLLQCRLLGGRSRDETIHPSRTRPTRHHRVGIDTGADYVQAGPATRLRTTFGFG